MFFVSRYRLCVFISWVLCFVAYLIPWVESGTGFLPGFRLILFTAPYALGLVLGFISLCIGTHRLLLAILAFVLMIVSVVCVIFYWYSLALHYVATGGGVAELEIGVWLALIASTVYLVLNILLHRVRKIC